MQREDFFELENVSETDSIGQGKKLMKLVFTKEGSGRHTTKKESNGYKIHQTDAFVLERRARTTFEGEREMGFGSNIIAIVHTQSAHKVAIRNNLRDRESMKIRKTSSFNGTDKRFNHAKIVHGKVNSEEIVDNVETS